eukprot:TRINITY_DN1047_c0_g1_i3.p1 TRINITY_DN1047_c0_g1~~TRINITY_DN1047_c0_g1_i3.p1  ORF type:complete len:552 (-),score=149.97 TRINITY_DN1047_c0_g1_i3:81-1736(-)
MSTAFPNLANAVVHLSYLRETAREDLVEILNNVRGGKPLVLVLDPTILGPIGLIAEASLLKENGVEKIFLLNEPDLGDLGDLHTVLYITRPSIDLMKLVAKQIHAQAKKDISFFCFFVPRRTLLVERILEELGCLGDIRKMGEFNLDLIPFDDDLLSMELPFAFRECILDGDRTSLHYIARSMLKLQTLFGVIPNVMGKGDNAFMVFEMMKRMHSELSIDVLNMHPEIDTVIFVDREADMITPLMTQLTYEGLIDEIFGVRNGFMTVQLDAKPGDPKAAGADGKHAPPTKVPLNSSSRLYSEIRDLHVSAVGPVLNKKAVFINENYKERHHAKTVTQIRDFMKKFPNLQEDHKALGIHVNVAEKIQKAIREPQFRRKIEIEQSIVTSTSEKETWEYIEECMNRQEPLHKVLRLLCLASLTQNGLKTKQFEFFRKEILQTYGYEVLLTLHNLEKCGLLKRSESGKNAFPTLRKGLKLYDEGVDEVDPKDISFAYSGFAPLSVRLIQHAANGWSQLGELLRLIPGRSFRATQELSPTVMSAMGMFLPGYASEC